MHIHGWVEPMVAKSTDRLPDAEGLRFEVKLDGYRALAKIDDRGAVQLISRRGTRLDEAFPEIVGALYAYLPAGTMLDGEVVRWSPSGRLDFSALQRRYANRRRAMTLAKAEPCHYATFDVLESPKHGDLRRTKLSTRRQILERLMGQVPSGTPLALVMQTDDPDTAQLWCSTLGKAGCEGIVIKPADSFYVPGSRGGWRKFKTRNTEEAIVGGVTGRLRHPETLILGRYSTEGRLLMVGRTIRLSDRLAAEIGALLTRAGADHPWPAELALAWRGGPTRYIRVDPDVVVEVNADVAVDAGRWRHAVRYQRPRLDLAPADVPPQ
jgi:ATP-dependent DNA ligase